MFQDKTIFCFEIWMKQKHTHTTVKTILISNKV